MSKEKDPIQRASTNYFVQRQRYEALTEAIESARKRIEDAKRTIAECEAKLPQQRAWYLKAKAIYDQYGEHKDRAKARHLWMLQKQIADLEGRKFTIPEPADPGEWQFPENDPNTTHIGQKVPMLDGKIVVVEVRPEPAEHPITEGGLSA